MKKQEQLFFLFSARRPSSDERYMLRQCRNILKKQPLLQKVILPEGEVTYWSMS